MAFTLANWTCLSASLSQGQEAVIPFGGSSTKLNAPNMFMYESPNDTMLTIGSSNYFLPQYRSLSVGDFIIGSGTDTYFIIIVTSVSSTLVTTEPFAPNISNVVSTVTTADAIYYPALFSTYESGAQPLFVANTITVNPSTGDLTLDGSLTLGIPLSLASGGTGSNLSVVDNGVFITDNTGITSILANGAAGTVLTANTGAPPSWQVSGLPFVVGPGQKYTTIQSAINAATLIASSGAPQVVLIYPGTYTENIVINDFVNLTSLSDGNSNTFSLPTASSTVNVVGNAVYNPGTNGSQLSISGLTFTAPNAGGDAISINPGTVSARAYITLYNCSFYADNGIAFAANNSNILVNGYNCFFFAGSTGYTFDILGAFVFLFSASVQSVTNPAIIDQFGILQYFSSNIVDMYTVTNGASVIFYGGTLGGQSAPLVTVDSTSYVYAIFNVIAAGFTDWIVGTGFLFYAGVSTSNTIPNTLQSYNQPTLFPSITINGPVITTPPTSQASSLILGTAFQNTLGYDVILTVYISVTAATAASILNGVGPTSTPTQQTIVSSLTLAAVNIIPVTIYLPNNYYALLSTSGTITASISGQQIMGV